MPIDTKVTLFFSGFLVIFTGIYATVSICQLKALHKQTRFVSNQAETMKKQAEIASRQTEIMRDQARIMSQQTEISSKQMINGERAWMVVERASHNEFKVGEFPTVTLQFINAGNTPALNTTILITKDFRDTPVPTPMLMGKLAEQEVSKGVIGPRIEVSKEHQDTTRMVTPEIIDQINQEKMRLYVWGVISYDDIFHQHRSTQFCFFSHSGSIFMSPCYNNNTAD